MFGICLGHQILGLAAGGTTVKMKFGHHGANHPVQDLDSGRVFITSQNHGFAVDEATLPKSVRPTHRSLFDGSLQGIAFTDRPAFSFQGHPEASPGPHDLKPLFERFNHLMLRRLQAQLRAPRKRCGGKVASPTASPPGKRRSARPSRGAGASARRGARPADGPAVAASVLSGPTPNSTTGRRWHPPAWPVSRLYHV